MAKNEFLPFGTAANANVLSPDDYQALASRTTGFTSGVAKSKELNTAWRQASVMSSALGQFIANNSGKDVLDNGDINAIASNLVTAIANSILPVGVPIPYPSTSVPTGWLQCDGKSFDKVKYPLLSAAYPSGLLPDLRGEFIRGWDAGRGIDSGRTLLSEQEPSSVGNYASGTSTAGVVGVTVYNNDGVTADAAGWAGVDLASISTKIISQTKGAVRPRNIAFNYIVRAL